MNNILKNIIIVCFVYAAFMYVYKFFSPYKIFQHVATSKISPRNDIIAIYADDSEVMGFGGGIRNALILSSSKQKGLYAYSDYAMLKVQIIYYDETNLSAHLKDYKWLGDYELGVYLGCGPVQSLRNWYYGLIDKKPVQVKIKYFFPKDCPKETNTDFIQYGY